MSQQIANSGTVNDLYGHLGLYQLMRRSGLLALQTKENPDLNSIYAALISIEKTLVKDKAFLQSRMTGDVKGKLKQPECSDRCEILLTERENEILSLLSRGCSYNEIAMLLYCQVGTIQTHIKRIYKKLNVHSRSEAIFEAGQLGLIYL